MLQGRSITLIIPCYNEALGLPHVLQKVPKCVDEVLIVDNNSTDETAEIARSFGARVVVAPRQGYGAAYKVGFAACDSEIVVTLDGDGTYPLEEIERLVCILLADELDFISACRFPLKNPENMDRVSRIGNWGLTLSAKILFRYGLQDSQSGMWIFRRAILERLRIESDGMPLSEEIKIEALKKKLKFREVHIPYYMRFGEKKIRKFRDGLHNLWFLLYLRFRK
jgi:glycosyltransferase involved in cell wall biosynthesis